MALHPHHFLRSLKHLLNHSIYFGEASPQMAAIIPQNALRDIRESPCHSVIIVKVKHPI